MDPRKSAWVKAVSKALIDREMTKKDLANATGISYSSICKATNGNAYLPGVSEKVAQVLEIDASDLF